MAEETRSVPLQKILVRTFLSAFAWIALVMGRAYFKGTDLTPRKIGIVLSGGLAAAILASAWQWFGKKNWSWIRTLVTIMVLFLILLGLTIAGLSLQL